MQGMASDENEGEHVEVLAGAQAVRRGKVLVIYALLFCAAGVGAATFFFTASSETTNFTTSFAALASELLTTAERHLIQEVSLLTSYSSAITSSVEASGDEWPFVTVPNYEARSQEILSLTEMERITFVPLVPYDMIEEWEQYSVTHQLWIKEGIDFHGEAKVHVHPQRITPYLNGVNPNEAGYVAPIWQVSPVDANATLVNYDKFDLPWFKSLGSAVQENRHWLLSEEVDLSGVLAGVEPRGMICHPVHEKLLQNPKDSEVVAYLNGALTWGGLFRNVLQEKEEKFVVEIEDTCGKVYYTYIVEGPSAKFEGRGRFHDEKYEKIRESRIMVSSREKKNHIDHEEHDDECSHIFHIYPTDEFKQSFMTTKPWVYLLVVEGAFAFTTLVFVIYDYSVRQRQTKLKDEAESATAIVDSLFPKNVQRRILEAQNDYAGDVAEMPRKAGVGENMRYTPYGGKPIAELFSKVTIMFADICGFTAWSSTREPEHVFSLLENIYFAFDEIAQAHGVFKVETVGDCYVAACGLPEVNLEHHVVMARFAARCLAKFISLTRELVATMGPDVIALGLRVGLHSGPVTAGVLRGDRARFQLFGDSMNTAARIESTGERNKIQLSQETANLLTKQGKEHWISKREQRVQAKGKGLLQTYWLSIPSITVPNDATGESALKSSIATGTANHLHDKDSLSERRSCLVDWLVEILSRKLRELARYRAAHGMKPDAEETMHRVEQEQLSHDGPVIEEIQETVQLPGFSVAKHEVDPKVMKLSDDVIYQLRDYIETISKLYHPNDFHNFEHATHVTMSVNKLFHRIIGPVIASQGGHADVSPTLYEQTFGIASDPLTRFTIHLSALIHDVDHTGLPNTELVKMRVPVALKFNDKSVAEQNSVVVGWQLLMDDKYKALRRAIYTTERDFKRFRRLLVNIVMATDIMDKGKEHQNYSLRLTSLVTDLKALRNKRWETVFEKKNSGSKNRSRQATVILEHLIQASDVAHTMQHWHVYLKWNQRLFKEMYKAFENGQSSNNPLDNWYEGEIGFFDFYVIPLAKKLKDCGVFGVASEEYLTYAEQNRREWAERGQEVVREYAEMVRHEGGYDC